MNQSHDAPLTLFKYKNRFEGTVWVHQIDQKFVEMLPRQTYHNIFLISQSVRRINREPLF
jgi:hypothetical protein